MEVRVLRRASVVLRHTSPCTGSIGLPIPTKRTSDHASVAGWISEESARTGSAYSIHLVLVSVIGAVGHAGSLV